MQIFYNGYSTCDCPKDYWKISNEIITKKIMPKKTTHSSINIYGWGGGGVKKLDLLGMFKNVIAKMFSENRKMLSCYNKISCNVNSQKNNFHNPPY